MKRLAAVAMILLMATPALSEDGTANETPGAPLGGQRVAPSVPVEGKDTLTLVQVIECALKNSPVLAQSAKNVEVEGYGILSAKADRMPKVDFLSAVTRYRYPTPVTPITGFPSPRPGGVIDSSGFPRFDETILDTGLAFRLPLYKGGRLQRAVHIAEMRKVLAEDNLGVTRQELIYNVTSVYYKICQLEKLVQAHEAGVRQLELHRRNAESLLQAGSVPRVDLLKTDVELAHARQDLLLVQNSVASAYALLKGLMGMEDQEPTFAIVHDLATPSSVWGEACKLSGEALREVTENALTRRPEHRALVQRIRIAEERVKVAQGKRLPEIALSGEVSERSGEDLNYEDNWNVSLRVTVPIVDGGSIAAEVKRERAELAKLRDEERELRISVAREIKDALLAMENAEKRVEVARESIGAARENLRVERLKYEAGAGTSADVIDARTALVRTETEHYQGLYDRNIAVTSLRKALGEDLFGWEWNR